MDFEQLVQERRSVRSYDTDRKVSDDQLKRIFELVALSPSSYNMQPWHFIVIRDANNKKKLYDCTSSQQHILDASATIIVCGNLDPLERAEITFGESVKAGRFSVEEKNKRIEKLKKKAESEQWRRVWSTKSTSMACMALMFAAKNEGLDTCPIEGFDPVLVAERFLIPSSYLPLMLITLGYQKNPSLQRGVRKTFEEIVDFEEFKK